MSIEQKKGNNPLAEVFGFPITNQSERAIRYLKDKLCPFNNIVSNCTKNSLDFPLGVCSIFHKNSPVIICPVRFREDWVIISDAASFIFGPGITWTHVGEVKVKDKHGRPIGNIDYVLVAYDDKGRVLDFGSLEVQSVYITGNLTGPFKGYLEQPDSDFTWSNALKYPKPDYLSSSRKRLVPQIIAKGSILQEWKKKQVVALQTAFYDTLPPLQEFKKEESDFALFLYDLVLDPSTQIMSLKLQRIIYTQFIIALQQLATFEAGPIKDFTELIQRKLDAKRSGMVDPDTELDIVVE